MKARRRLWIGLVVLAAFGALAVLNLKKTITPYVSFAEAKASDRPIQVAGFPDHAGSHWDPSRGEFLFDMKNEEGELMPVSFKGVKPGNFDQAQSVVVVGRYQGGTLHADQILVKCPSKYESLGTQHPGNVGAGGANAAKPASSRAAETD
jgi:cytochrome c-type biogenesis protein CcmE